MIWFYVYWPILSKKKRKIRVQVGVLGHIPNSFIWIISICYLLTYKRSHSANWKSWMKWVWPHTQKKASDKIQLHAVYVYLYVDIHEWIPSCSSNRCRDIGVWARSCDQPTNNISWNLEITLWPLELPDIYQTTTQHVRFHDKDSLSGHSFWATGALFNLGNPTCLPMACS